MTKAIGEAILAGTPGESWAGRSLEELGRKIRERMAAGPPALDPGAEIRRRHQDLGERYRRLIDRAAPADLVRKILDPRRGGLAPSEALREVQAWLGDHASMILVLAGATQLGKTTAALWGLDQVRPESVYFAYANGGLMRVDLLARNDAHTLSIESARYLVLDDLGPEYLDAGGLMLARLDWVLCQRCDRGLRTIVTTNLGFSDFVARYKADQRILERIDRRGRFYEVTRGWHADAAQGRLDDLESRREATRG